MAGSWTGTSPRGIYKPTIAEDPGDTDAGAWKNFDTSLTNIHNKLWRDNVINVKSDYGATGDGVTDDTTAIQAAITAIGAQNALTGSGFTAAPTIVFPEGDYKITEITFATLKNITIRAYGARFHYTGSGKAFSFTSCKYLKWFGGQIYLDNDTSSVMGMYLFATTYSIFRDLDIGSADATYDTANYGIKLYGSDAGFSGYNKFENIRLYHLGWGLRVETDDAEASESWVNDNIFDHITFLCSNGLYLAGVWTNHFRITLENQTNQISLKDTAGGIGTRENIIEVLYYGTNAYSNTIVADTNSEFNRITDYHSINNVGPTQADHLIVPGNNYVLKLDRQYGGVRVEDSRIDDIDWRGGERSLNYVPYSEDFSQWTNTNLTVTTDSVAAPDGNTTADTLTQNAADGKVMAETVVIGNDLDNTGWIASVWLKAAATQYATIALIDYSGAANRTREYKHIYVTTSWKRFFVREECGATPSASDTLRMEIFPTREGGGATGALYAWGAQISPGYLNPYRKTAGSVIAIPNQIGIEFDNSDAASSGTGEDDLKSTVIPSSSLGGKGGIKITAAGTISGANDTKTIKLYFGATSVTIISAAAGDQTDWRIEAEIFNTAINAQRMSWMGLESDGTITSGYDTAAITTNNATPTTLKLTGECAHADDTITQTMWIVERL
jgi:hypothetical protein